MATSVNINGVSYSIPATGEGSWGTNVSNYLIALSTGVLQKSGGAFTLTADVDFGATFGLKSIYYKSRATASSAGVVRLGNAESVGWRNAANSADKLLKVNASDVLEFDGNPIVTLALGTADYVLKMNAAGTAYSFAQVINASVKSDAAIAYSKLAALTASKALVSDGSGVVSVATTTATQIGYLSAATGTTGTTSTNVVFSTSPTLVTPVLGAATATSINGLTITSSTGTLTVANGKTASVSNTLTFTGTDSSSVAFGAGGTVLYNGGALGTPSSATLTNATGLPVSTGISGLAAGVATFLATPSSANLATAVTDETGSGALVFGTSPSLTTPQVAAGSYINMLTQAAVRFNDDAGGDYVALQAPTGVTTHTLKLPATQGAASTVLANDGSGNLSWAAAASTTLTTGFVDIGDGSNNRMATNTLLLGDVSGSVASQTYAVTAAAPGVFTVAAAPATGTKAYVTVTQNGFTANTTYYVTNVSSTTFKLATTLANAVAGTNITSSGTTAGVVVSGGFALTSGVKGTVTNDSATAGYVGERVVATSAGAYSNVPAATSQWGDVNSFVLTAGDWDVSCNAVFQANGATVVFVAIGVSSTSGNSTAGLIDGDNRLDAIGPTANYSSTVTMASFRVSLTATTTYYLKAIAQYTVATPRVAYRISARRIR